MTAKSSAPTETPLQRWWWRVWYVFFASVLVWLGVCVWLTRPAPSWAEGWLAWWTADRQDHHPSFAITTKLRDVPPPIYHENNLALASEFASQTELGRFPSGLERWTWAGWIHITNSIIRAQNDPQPTAGRPWIGGFNVLWATHSLADQMKFGVNEGKLLLTTSYRQGVPLKWDTGWFHSPERVPFNEWFHVAIARDSHRVRIWLNGVNALSAPTIYPNASSLAKLSLRAEYFHLPDAPHAGGSLYRILHDDLVVFDRVLSDDEAASLHHIKRGGWVAEIERLPLGKKVWSNGWPWVVAMLVSLLVWKLAPKLAAEVAEFVRVASMPLYRPVRWIAVIGLLGSLVTAVVISVTARRGDEHRFKDAVARFQKDISSDWERVAALCVRAKDWVAQQPELTQDRWENWLTSNRAPYDYPGLVGIGYAEQVLPSQLGEHEAKWQQRHGFHYRVSPGAETPRFPVQELEGNPLLPVVVYRSTDAKRFAWFTNQTFLGRDLLHQSITDLRSWSAARRVEESAARNEIQTSSLEEIGPASVYGRPLKGLQIYAPDTRRAKKDNPQLILESAAWRGLAFADVDFERMLLDRLGTEPSLIGFKIYTGSIAGDRFDLVADSSSFLPSTGQPKDGRLQQTAEQRFYYRRLFIDFWTTPAFEEGSLRKWAWIFGLGGMGMTTLAMSLVVVQLRAREAQNRVLNALEVANMELLKAYRERERLSRDLHDGSIQNLYALGLHLQRVQALFGAQSNRAKSEISESLALLDHSIADLRQFILSTERKELPKGSPVEALHELVEQHRRTTDTEFVVRMHEDSRRLSSKACAHLLPMAREGISNALRHGKARRIELQLDPSGPAPDQRTRWIFEVRDDGQGFDEQNAGGNGLGLKNLKARAAELEGECIVESAPNCGTTVRVTFTDHAPTDGGEAPQTRTE